MSTETNHTDFDRELLSAYVDGELTAVERAAVEARLASDPAAQRHVEEFRRLSGMIQSLPRPTLAGDFSAKVLQRAKDAQPAAEVEPLRPGLSIGRTWRSWLWPAAALAAALLIAVMVPRAQRELADREVVATSSPAPESGAVLSDPANEAVPEIRFGGTNDRPLPARSEEALLADGTKSSGGSQAGESSRMSIPDDFNKNAEAAKEQALSNSALPAENAQFVIVRVSMPADALQRRELDQLLAKQDIEVESGGELDESRVDEAETLLRREAQDRARGVAGKLDSLGAEDKLGLELARKEPVEFVLVEAPPEQIAATLSAMKADEINYQVVEVEQDSPTEFRQYNRGQGLSRGGFGGGIGGARHDSLAEEKAAEGESGEQPPSDLASSTPEERPKVKAETESSPASATPPVAAFETSPPPTPAPAAAPTLAPPTGAAPEGAVDPGKFSFETKIAKQGKAYRYLAKDAKELGRGRFARQSTDEERPLNQFYAGGLKKGDKPPLQVLFVLESAPPAVAAPTEEKPLPAGPAEQPK